MPRTKQNNVWGVVFLATLALWLALPVLQLSDFAQDAVPFVSAGQIARSDPHDLYVSTPDERLRPAMQRTGCALAPDGTRCDTLLVTFLAPPQLLPVLALTVAAGGSTGIFLLRMLSVAAFAGGMVVLWRRLTSRRPEAELPLVATAIALTPYAYYTAAVGQNSPVLFLSASLGISQTDRGRAAAGTAFAFVAAVLFKVFPIALVLVALWHRRWKFLAWTAGILAALTALSLAFTPPSLYADFLDTSRMLTVNRVASPFNISVDSVVHLADPTWLGSGAAFYAFIVGRVAALGGLFWWKLRDADDDAQWAWVWLALLLVHPQIWWHYLPVIVPATAYLVGVGRGWRRWAVPISAVVIVPAALFTDPDQIRVVALPVVLAATIALPFLARPPKRPTVIESRVSPLPSSG